MHAVVAVQCVTYRAAKFGASATHTVAITLEC
jgi:hypothetical protein